MPDTDLDADDRTDATKYVSGSQHTSAVWHSDPACSRLHDDQTVREASDAMIAFHDLSACQYCTGGRYE